MTDEQRVARGRRAFSEFTEIGAAFDSVESAIMKALAETPVGQEIKVLNLHKAVQNLAAVRKALQDVIDDGLMAEHAISAAGLTRPYS
jgi:signal transduction protein with GAF and PtsI domain